MKRKYDSMILQFPVAPNFTSKNASNVADWVDLSLEYYGSHYTNRAGSYVTPNVIAICRNGDIFAMVNGHQLVPLELTLACSLREDNYHEGDLPTVVVLPYNSQQDTGDRVTLQKERWVHWVTAYNRLMVKNRRKLIRKLIFIKI